MADHYDHLCACIFVFICCVCARASVHIYCNHVFFYFDAACLLAGVMNLVKYVIVLYIGS